MLMMLCYQPRAVMLASCCDASLMLKILSLVLILMMLQPSRCDVDVVDDVPARVVEASPPPVRNPEARSERERPRTALPPALQPSRTALSPALQPSRTALSSSKSRSLPLPEPPCSRSLSERSRPRSLTYNTRSRSLGTVLPNPLERSSKMSPKK
jgi:hypothetical protein